MGVKKIENRVFLDAVFLYTQKYITEEACVQGATNFTDKCACGTVPQLDHAVSFGDRNGQPLCQHDETHTKNTF